MAEPEHSARATPVAESPVGPWLDRLIAVVVVAAAAGMVYALRRVRPDGRGFGTHEQLGMQPCGWPASYGFPCPTCGVTTAASHLVHLEPIDAMIAQPFGAALALVGLLGAGYAAVCLLTGRSYMDRIVRLPYGTAFVVGLILLFASWLYKTLTFSP